MAVAEFRQGEIISETPGPMTEFCVTVMRKPIEHRIRLAQVTKWAQPNTREGPAGSRSGRGCGRCWEQYEGSARKAHIILFE